MKTIGGQKRELLAKSDYHLVFDKGEHKEGVGVILQNETDGNLEYWCKNDGFAGYVIEIDGVGYEFVRTVS